MDSSYKRVKFIAYSNAFSEGPPAVNESTPTEKKNAIEKRKHKIPLIFSTNLFMVLCGCMFIEFA